MIFVTIGTQAPFDRFIRLIDDIAPELNEEVVAQVHHCGFTPRHIRTVSFLPSDEFQQLFSQARLIVAHAGMGTILSALEQGKPIIIFPRIAALGEHRNEHQLATARKLRQQGSVYVAMTDEELRTLLLTDNLKPLRHIGTHASPTLVQAISDDLADRYVRMLNINIVNTTEDDLLADLHEGMLVTPNLDHLVMLQDDQPFYDAYRQAEWVVCDSRVLYFISRLTRHPLRQAIAGSTFFTHYCDYHRHDAGCRLFLLGGMGDTAQRAMQRINQRLSTDTPDQPGRKGEPLVVGACSPSWGFDKKDDECRDIIEQIRLSRANVVLVGVGAPKQEKWIARWRPLLPEVRLWMALGATIDFEAGTQQRAPQLWRTLGMEWFYRFLREPRRLFRRYFLRDMRFFRYFLRQLLNSYKNPFAK